MRVPRDGHTSVVQGEYIIHIGGSGDKVRPFVPEFRNVRIQALNFRPIIYGLHQPDIALEYGL